MSFIMHEKVLFLEVNGYQEFVVEIPQVVSFFR